MGTMLSDGLLCPLVLTRSVAGARNPDQEIVWRSRVVKSNLHAAITLVLLGTGLDGNQGGLGLERVCLNTGKRWGGGF